MNESYKTVKGIAEAEIIERKSRFISHISHAETEADALAFISSIREANQQARHNVYAYLLRDGRTRYSDDGEPAQTSGLPTFETIEHANLTDVVIVTTRYFGGILLGTGGLVRAYTAAAKEAISHARIVEICLCVDLSFKVPYALNSQVQRILRDLDASIISCDYSDVVSYAVRVRADETEKASSALTEATHGQTDIKVSEPRFSEL